MATDPTPVSAPAADVAAAGPGKLQQRRWLLLLLAVLALAVGTKLVFDQSRVLTLGTAATPTIASADLAASALPGTASLPSTEAEATWGQPSLAAERVGRAASAALATARAATGLGPQPPAEVVMELCGVGRMTLPVQAGASATAAEVGASLQPLPAPLGRWAIDAAWPRVLQAMAEDTRSERVRAAAMVLRAAGVSTVAYSTVEARLVAQRQLVALARTSTDTTVMRWALAFCETARTAECRRISSKDLSRLAPDDAHSWLAVAATAQAKPAEREAALDRAAQAARWGDTRFQLAQALDSAWPADLPEYLRLELLVQAIGVEAAFPDQTLSTLFQQMCSTEALQQPEARQRCETLARKQQFGATSLDGLGVARSLGRRLGWPEAEVAAMTAELAALRQQVLIINSDQPYACKSVQDARQYIGAVVQDGELQVLRQRVANRAAPAQPAAGKS